MTHRDPSENASVAPVHSPRWRARFLLWLYPGRAWGRTWRTASKDSIPEIPAAPKPTPGRLAKSR